MLNFSIILTFCLVTNLTISGKPSGTAATMIVAALLTLAAILLMISNTFPEKYWAKPACIMPETVIVTKAMIAAIVPHLLIKLASLPKAMSKAVLGASKVCMLIKVSPFTVSLPTTVTFSRPSPATTTVPAKR